MSEFNEMNKLARELIEEIDNEIDESLDDEIKKAERRLAVVRKQAYLQRMKQEIREHLRGLWI